MIPDDELEKNLEWHVKNQGGPSAATAAAGLAILRAVRRFDSNSIRLGYLMAALTVMLVLLTAWVGWLTMQVAK